MGKKTLESDENGQQQIADKGQHGKQAQGVRNTDLFHRAYATTRSGAAEESISAMDITGIVLRAHQVHWRMAMRLTGATISHNSRPCQSTLPWMRRTVVRVSSVPMKNSAHTSRALLNDPAIEVI